MIKKPGECTKRYFIMRPSQIHLLRFTMEAYEGICVVTTLDPELGMVLLQIAPGCENLINNILNAESAHLALRPVYPDPFYDSA